MRITVTVPRVQASQLASNVLGAAGLVGLVAAVGALAGDWWWSVLTGSVVAVALAWVANVHAQAERQHADEAVEEPLRVVPMAPAAAPTSRSRSV